MIESAVRIVLGVFAFFGLVAIILLTALCAGIAINSLFGMGLSPDDMLNVGIISIASIWLALEFSNNWKE